MKLSVLIPSTWDREEMTESLKYYLEALSFGLDVEILIKYDNREMSVGAKRQMLLEEATGDYVVFCDSDDHVPKYYFLEIFRAMEETPDVIGIEVDCIGTPKRKAVTSSKYKKWENNKDGYDYVRSANHLCPIKREIALQIGFKDIRYAEDYDYSMRLAESGLIKSEVFIPKKMYEYRFKQENSKTKYGLGK